MMHFLLRRLGPWAWVLLIAQAVLVIRQHLRTISPEDLARVQQLVRKSGGRPGNLSTAERRELWRSVYRLRPGKLVRDIALNVVRPGRSARRERS